jgi:hypothetical protein
MRGIIKINQINLQRPQSFEILATETHRRIQTP